MRGKRVQMDRMEERRERRDALPASVYRYDVNILMFYGLELQICSWSYSKDFE